jgi:hypothetical protein
MTDTEATSTPGAVQRLPLPSRAERLRAAAGRSRAPAISPELDGPPRGDPGPADPAEDEIALDVLLRSVRLTPRQTAFVIAEIVRTIGARHDEGRTHGAVSPAAVRVGLSSGRVRLVDAEIEETPEDWLLPTTPVSREQQRLADLQATARTVIALTDDTRSPAAQRDPRRRVLLTALDELGAGLTAAAHGTAGDETPARLAGLSLVAGPRGRYPGAQQELVALAATALRSGPRPTAPSTASPSAPVVTPVRSPRTAVQRALTRFSLLLVALGALGVVMILEFTFLGARLTSDLSRLAGSGSSATVAPAAPAAATTSTTSANVANRPSETFMRVPLQEWVVHRDT